MEFKDSVERRKPNRAKAIAFLIWQLLKALPLIQIRDASRFS